VVGFIAGLLGIGGGMTMIPLLTLIFSYEHFPTDDTLHIAAATSMATIVFTSIASVRAHNRHRAVLWPVFWELAPGILIGSLAGPQIVSGMSTQLLSAVFGVFTTYTATCLLRNKAPKASREMPGAFGLLLVGSAIGVLSSMVGAGRLHLGAVHDHDGVQRSPSERRGDLRRARPADRGGRLGGTSDRGFSPSWLTAVHGGLHLPARAHRHRQRQMLVAPIGVRLAHRWPVARLRKAFAGLMYLIAAFFLWKLVEG
jgi:uncharacterized protein